MKLKLYALVLSLGLAVGCATVQTNPSGEDQAAVRAIAQDASSGIRIGQGLLTQAADLLNQLPVDAKVKTDLDCAIVKVNGTSTPRPNLLTICGPDTPQGPGPLVGVLEKLKAVTSRASLQSTLTAAKGQIEPLLAKLETSDNPSLRFAGASIRLAFAVVLAGGVQ